MPISPGTFSSRRPLDALRNYRAYSDVVLSDARVVPARKSPTIKCLVDTGSDFTILPLRMAHAVGIALPKGPPISITTVVGTSLPLATEAGLDLIIEGFLVPGVQVAFSSAPKFTPILGRLELIQAFDVGFSIKDWHWD